MASYIFKRVIVSFITIFIIITITFLLMRFIPGGPFSSEHIPPEVQEMMEEQYGLNDPIIVQYIDYIRGILHGDLGPSYTYKGYDVTEVIRYSLPPSLKVGALSIAFGLAVGLTLGITSALKQGTWIDKTCTIVATIGYTIPSFIVANFLIYIFAIQLQWLPATGLNSWQGYIMPVFVLSLVSISYVARLVRTKLVEVLHSDYIRTARAKGLSEKKVIMKHAMKNALIPVVTFMGPLVIAILTGSFVVEQIFAIPGLGNEFVDSITNRDYPLICGITLFYCTAIVFMNLFIDIIYVFLDPRIKLY